MQGELDVGGGSPTIRAFFVQQAQSTSLSGFSTVALRVKASALFEGANRLSSSWSPRKWLQLVWRYDHDDNSRWHRLFLSNRLARVQCFLGELQRIRTQHYAFHNDIASAPSSRGGYSGRQVCPDRNPQPCACIYDPLARALHAWWRRVSRKMHPCCTITDSCHQAHRGHWLWVPRPHHWCMFFFTLLSSFVAQSLVLALLG